MKHFTFNKTAWSLLIFLLLTFSMSFVVPAVSAGQPAQSTATVWMLEKAWTKEEGAFKDMDVIYSISNGSVTASRSFVTYDGAQVTWEGTNSWTAPPAQLVPGETYSTTLAGTALVTTSFGASNIAHETTLWVGSEEIGHVRAWSLSDQGAASDSKTVTWQVPAGGGSGDKLVITIGASGTQGTLNYIYQYTWQEAGSEIPTLTQPAPQQLIPQNTAINDSGARVSDLHGQVEWRPHDDEEAWSVLHFDTVIPVDAHIKTAEKSQVIISFADMSTFTLEPESEIVISSPAAADSQIKLLWGNLWVNLKKMAKDGSMEIEMSQAVAGIKGTTLVLEETGDQSTLKVIEGRVEYTSRANGDVQYVEAGEMVVATASGLSEKTTFDPKAEEAKWQAESEAIKREDSTPVTKAPFNLPNSALLIVLCGGAGLLVFGLVGLGTLATRRSRSSPAIGWLVGGIAVLGLCCLLIGASALLFPSARQFLDDSGLVPGLSETQDTPSPGNVPVTELAMTAIPSEVIASATSISVREAQVFRDDFSNPSTGWLQLDDGVRMVGYSEGAVYAMALLQPGSDAEVLIPHEFELPLTEVSLYFRARPVDGDGYFGVMCNYIDTDNYTLIGISEGAYVIYRNENGQFIHLLDELGERDPNVKSENNEFQVKVVCGGDKIQLMVNGYSIPDINSPEMTGGDVAFFAHSDQDAVADFEFFYQVLFDDLELNAR